jgi:Mitochondrial biogenesis AIM24
MESDVTLDRLLLEATERLFQGDLVKAHAKINKALARKVGEPRALGVLASILSHQKDHAGSAAIYRNLLREFSDEPTLHLRLGIECFAMGDLTIAYEEVMEAERLDPENVTLGQFKKHIAKAMGFIKDYDADPSELPEELYQIVIKVYSIVESSTESEIARNSTPKKKPKKRPQKITKEQLKQDKENKKKSKKSLGSPQEESNNEDSLQDDESDNESDDESENLYPALEKFVTQTSEGIYYIDPSIINALAFSKDCLVLPLASSWYFRKKLLLCSYMDFESIHAEERFRGSNNNKNITDEITGDLIKCTGKGSVILKPKKDYTFLAFDISNTPLYIREEMVVAFQGNLKWESGWLRSENNKLGMMSFRGNGKIFLHLKGDLFNMKLPEEEFLLAPLTSLIGWEGYVVAQCNEGEIIHVAGNGHLFLRN